MNPNTLFPLPRFVSLIGILATIPFAEAGSISRSAAFPVMNQAVTLTVSEDLLNTPISVAGPLGNSQLTPDAQGQVVWTPARYGKYTLTCGDATNAIWVTARPMKFHWWSCTTAQKNVTEVMQNDPAWQARGVTRVDWTGGEAYSRGVDGHNWTTATEWYNGWNYAYTKGGMALDEIFCNDVAPMPAILDAVAMVRQAKGPAYTINVWSAGFGGNFSAGAAKLKASNATVLIEDYYGGWNNHKSRWDAVRAYGLQNQAISGIWPGTTNLTNETQIRTDVALVRLAEPNANGIAMFAPTATNYTPNNLTTLLNDCDKAIEDYYLKPLIHLSVTPSEQLVVWNLGNEDAVGFSLQLLDGSGGVMQTIDLSGLVANGKQTLAIPAGAKKAKVLNPPDTANLYTGNSQYSNGIFPLLVPGRYTFTHANGDHLWSTFSNWDPHGPPGGGIDSGNYAYFTNGGTNVTATGGETSISSVQFTDAGWTINGNATSQNFYTYGITSSGAGTNTINIGMSSRDVVPASFTVGQDNTLVMNGLIGAARNNGGLIKNGPGTLTVNHVNTFTGGTSISAGSLRIGGAGTLGSGNYAGAITNNGAMVYDSSANQTFSGNISGTGTLTHSGSGTLTLSGNNSYGGATTISAGKLVFSKTSTNSPGSTVFTVNPGGTLQLNNTGALWDGCGSGITINGGTASLGGTGTVVYYGAGSINMTGGTLTLANNWAPYGSFRVTTKASPTTATVNGAGGFTNYNPALNFIVERGAAAADLNVALALGGTGALNKTGAGVLALATACNYSGATAVNEGTLLVNGSTSATSGITTTAIATLGGTGNAAGTVTAAGTISPGTTGTGTLTTGAATLTGTYACQIDGASADRWNVSGNLNLTGSTLAVSEISPATFTSTVIAKYTGTLTGSFTVTPPLPVGVAVQYDAATKEIRLVSDYNSLLASQAFAPGTNTALSGDSDGDGLTNLQEYAFGLSLTDGSSLDPITIPLDKTNATFTYTRRKPSLTGLTYKIWTSTDLATWTEDGGAQQSATDNGDNQSVRVTLSAPAPLSASKLYIRCSAE